MSDENVKWPVLGFDAVDAGLAVLDRETRVRAWNSCLASLTGISAELAMGKTLEQTLGAEISPRLLTSLRQAIESGASSTLSHALHPSLLPLPDRLGRPVLHNVTVTPIGELGSYCLLHVADITSIALREKVLRERQNARYDAVVDSAPDAIVTVDAGGAIQWINKAAERSFGYASAEVVGRPLAALLGVDGLGQTLRTVLQGAALARPVEIIGQHKDGRRIDLEVSASRWASHDRIFVTAILRDITARKLADRTLRRLNETLESIAAERTADRDRMWLLSSDLMIVARRDGVITATNPAANLLLGATDDRLVGSNIRDLFMEDDRPGWDAAQEKLTSASLRFELRVTASDGKLRWIDWNAVAADDFLQAVGRDITSEKEAEFALRSAEEALRQSQKMDAIGQLTGGIAHDFNNLLAGVIGAMEIVKRRLHTGRTEDLTRFTDAAIGSANRAAALTHRLLAFARQQPLNPQPHDINELIVGMDELLRRSVGEQIKVRTFLSPSIGLAATDGNQLENAILNLVINARDAMADGGTIDIITSSTKVNLRQAVSMDGVAPGEYVCVSVKDTGTGMPAEVMAKAFDPFFTTKPIGKGTGLGLSMIYGFAKQSKGHARIESEVGRGTTVTLYLPRTQAGAQPIAGEAVLQAPSGKGETVLVIEDDASVRMLITEVLHELGYAAIEAADSRGALPILTSDARLDLVISDVGLPGMDGKKLAEIARQHRPTLRILFVTGYAEHAKVRDEFLGEGMDMITKPFSLDTLGHKVREMLA
ncbi:MAG: PAS domain S-box protein [Alphaproteobacteria bacterium]|nr:MAG: PAS domain S-box protein [Alphaproteobacteria bacterium]